MLSQATLHGATIRWRAARQRHHGEQWRSRYGRRVSHLRVAEQAVPL